MTVERKLFVNTNGNLRVRITQLCYDANNFSWLAIIESFDLSPEGDKIALLDQIGTYTVQTVYEGTTQLSREAGPNPKKSKFLTHFIKPMVI